MRQNVTAGKHEKAFSDYRVLLYGKASLSVLIGPFLVGISPVETVISCGFLTIESRQIQNKHGPSAM